MKGLSLVFGLLSVSPLAGQTVNLDFDQEAEFQFIDMPSDSRVVLKQGDVLFSCLVTDEEDYVKIEQCKPLMTQPMKRLIASYNAAIEQKSEAEAELREAKTTAYKDELREKLGALAEVTPDHFDSAVLAAAAANDCVLDDAKNYGLNDGAIELVWAQLGFADPMNKESKVEMSKRLYSSIGRLDLAGKISTVEKYSIKVKDCN